MSMVGERRGAASAPTQREQSGQNDARLEEIRKCVPTKNAVVKAKLFRLSRLAFTVGGRNGHVLHREIFDEWFRQCDAGILGRKYDTLRAEFGDGIEKAEHTIGSESHEAAWERSAGLNAPEAALYMEPVVRRLVSWFYKLQLLNPGRVIFIGTRDIASKLGFSDKKGEPDWRKASLLVRMLVRDGILLEKEKGNEFRAPRYVYASLCEDVKATDVVPESESGDEQSDVVDGSDQIEEVGDLNTSDDGMRTERLTLLSRSPRIELEKRREIEHWLAVACRAGFTFAVEEGVLVVCGQVSADQLWEQIRRQPTCFAVLVSERRG